MDLSFVPQVMKLVVGPKLDVVLASAVQTGRGPYPEWLPTLSMADHFLFDNGSVPGLLTSRVQHAYIFTTRTFIRLKHPTSYCLSCYGVKLCKNATISPNSSLLCVRSSPAGMIEASLR